MKNTTAAVAMQSAEPSSSHDAPPAAAEPPLSALFAGRFDEYFDRIGDDGAALWMLLHIPKTAGSSFRAEIAQALRPQINVHINHHDLSVPAHVQMDQAFEAFLAANAARPYRFASGHFTSRHCRQALAQVPNARLITVLRHPVERVISEYRYQRTKAHPSHEQFRARFPSFRDFYNEPAAQNAMSRYLAPDWDGAPAPETIEFVAASYSFVGLVEMYLLTVKTVFALLGYEHRPRLHIRRTADLTEDPLEVTDEERREVRALNRDDIAVFAHFTEKMKEIREGLFEHIRGMELKVFELD